MATLDLNVDMMPPLIQRIAALTTPALAIKFARTYGGQKVYVPRKIYSAHPLVKCLGWSAAQRVSAEFGTEELIVPSASVYLTWLDARVLRAWGLSQPDIARRLGITLRHVGRLLAGFDPYQIELNDVLRSIGRRYGVGVAAPAAKAAGVRQDNGQASFGWPADALGRRLTGD
jgi:hypothetical protein